MSDRTLRRAGMDYIDHAALQRHVSLAAFEAWRTGSHEEPPRLVLLTTRASVRHVDFAFTADDILMLGRESAGVPDSVHATVDARVRIPMRPALRSLNIAVAAGMVLGEALRQTKGWPA